MVSPLKSANWIFSEFYKVCMCRKFVSNKFHPKGNTPPPLYNTIVGIQSNFRVSYPNRVIWRVKYIGYIGKGVLNSHLGSNPDPCYIQNRVITNRAIKRLRCTFISYAHFQSLTPQLGALYKLTSDEPFKLRHQ